MIGPGIVFAESRIRFREFNRQSMQLCKRKRVPGTTALQKGLGEHPVQSVALEDSKDLSFLLALRYKSHSSQKCTDLRF